MPYSKFMNEYIVSVSRTKQTGGSLTISPEVYFQLETNPVEAYVDLEEEPSL